MTFPLAPGRAVCAVMAAAALLAPAATTAQETRQSSRTGGGPHVRVELIASQATLGPEMWLGLRFDLDPDWHIYWLNPGDSGGPPEARWGLPPGLQVAAFEWPAPYRFEVGGMINYGYHGTVVLPVRVITASDTPPPAGTVTAAVRWLACANVCISGRSDLALSFPLGPDERREAAGWKTAIDAARSRVPKPAPPAWKAEARAAGEAFVVDVVTGSREAQAVFFPLEVSEVDDSAPQEVIPRPDGVRLVLRQSRQLVGVPGVLTGVLSLSGGRTYVIEAPFRQDEGPGQESRSQNPEVRIQKPEARSQKSEQQSEEFQMKQMIAAAALAIAAVVAPITIDASRVGAPAPEFNGTDTKGKVHSLSDFKGKWVVLEWHNEGCPYVKKHYGGNNMQQLQKEWTAKGVVWLTVISSATGQQGYLEPAQADAYFAQQNASPSAVLLDPTGQIGRLYEAKTTPHMFVVNPEGMLVYNGAIDDKPTSDKADLATATNYVSAALSDGMAGKAVTVPTSRPYGCGVKYAR